MTGPRPKNLWKRRLQGTGIVGVDAMNTFSGPDLDWWWWYLWFVSECPVIRAGLTIRRVPYEDWDEVGLLTPPFLWHPGIVSCEPSTVESLPIDQAVLSFADIARFHSVRLPCLPQHAASLMYRR